MQSQREEDAFAEAAAFSMAVTKAIEGLTSLADDKGSYQSRVLEGGLRDLDKVDCRHIPDGRRAAFRDNVKARYIDLIATIIK